MQRPEGIRTQQETMRLALENILFITDCSPSSEVALRYALALARHYDGKIYVAHAAAMDSVESIDREAKQKALDAARAVVFRCMNDLRESGKLDGARYEVLVGEEETALVNLPEHGKFDLFVSGVGYRERQTLVLAPAIEEVIRTSQCPVLSMGSVFHEKADGEVKHVLFATDFSPESLEASRYALSLAQEYQARLTVLHVVEGSAPKFLDEKSQAAKPFKLWLGKLVPDEARLWCELAFAVEFGRPAERILQVAWETHADLIVLGARGFRRMTSPGLNVRKVMSNAWCPVLTTSGVLDSHKHERLWRAVAAATENRKEERITAVS
jgi:nucleotide-binding universal stress UspA family protein